MGYQCQYVMMNMMFETCFEFIRKFTERETLLTHVHTYVGLRIVRLSVAVQRGKFAGSAVCLCSFFSLKGMVPHSDHW